MTIAEVLLAGIISPSTDAAGDFEYAERNGIIHVPRFYKDSNRNMALSPRKTNQAAPVMMPFQQSERSLRLEVDAPGHLSTLIFADDETVKDKLPPGCIEVEPRAFGVNFLDVMAAMGQVDQRSLGVECSGIVTRVGSAVAPDRLKVGDHVMCTMEGHYANRVRLPWTSAVLMPQDMGFELAASIPHGFSHGLYFSLPNSAASRGPVGL